MTQPAPEVTRVEREDIMSKTYWSVQYRVWSVDRPLVAWFDSKESAAEFAKRDYTDKPIRRTYTNADKIKQVEELVNITQFKFNTPDGSGW